MKLTFLLICAAWTLISCQESKQNKNHTEPDLQSQLESHLLPDRIPIEGPLFTSIPASESGLDEATIIDTSHPKAYLYNGGYLCGGVAVGDLNGDGTKDLFIVGNRAANRIYLHRSPFKFEKTSDSGVEGGSAWGGGAALIDIDTDGDLDIYVCNFRSPNQLFINESTPEHLSFVDKAADYGLDLTDASLMPYFCDYDRDGDLDVFIVCYRYILEGGTPQDGLLHDVGGKPALKPGLEDYYRFKHLGGTRVLVSNRGRADFLLRNDNGKFTDVSEAAGIYGTGFGLSAHWFDYDRDGHPDLYVANDLESADRLYRNRGDGTFVDVIQEDLPHTTWFSMGSTVADFNNDGLSDLFTLDMAGTTHYKSKMAMGEMGGMRRIILETSEPRQMMRNALLLNTGLNRFQEGAFLAGIANSDWSWAPVSADFDEDGHVDLYVTNGMSRDFGNSDKQFTEEQKVGKTEWDLYSEGPPMLEKNILFKNQGDLKFKNYASKWGLDHEGISVAAVPADFDDDGDLDLIVMNLGEPPLLYRNNASEGKRLTVRLKGTNKNPDAIGSRIEVRTPSGKTYVREVWPQTGFLGNHDGTQHFGFGSEDSIELLTVTWPDQRTSSFHDLSANQALTISREHPKKTSPSKPTPLFKTPKQLPIPSHQEKPFKDFDRQPLLPNQYSQLGPGQAWGDVNNDGIDDLYLGGAAEQAGRLIINSTNGQLSLAAVPDFQKDAVSEDLGAIFFDADNDNDLDLFVASGSYEFEDGASENQNRLYLNNGKGNFSSATTLPNNRKFSGAVAADDFDRDGDIDLFIGTRMIAGKYPVSATSHLWINQTTQGQAAVFTDSTEQFKNLGLVTSALWSDVDADGWNDLLVTLEWGAVTLFKNKEGTLATPVPLSKNGWWNSIVPGDFDNDGDLDYAVGNTGLNTKYKASTDHPVVAYFGDPTNSGTPSFIEAKYEGDTLLPVRGKSCSTNAIPALSKRFPTFDSFASSSLSQIYGDDSLDSAQKFQIEELNSGILINDGNLSFSFTSLPRIAQISPVCGMSVLDVNADGKQDLILAQNFYGPQAETGRFDGGVSQILLGRGDNSFHPLPTANSGILVERDATAVTVADVNRDQRPDLVFAQNNGPLKFFLGNFGQASDWKTFRINGPKGNPSALGTRFVATFHNNATTAFQVSGGDSYFTQQPPVLWIANPSSSPLVSIQAFWPDGTSSQHKPDLPLIKYPKP